ncbi:hypothetical protein [Castellaniella caeni]|uniref:hypothetical protein n=1 Tax=Castellaniella caeni TaxID=266123 RepID=UPI001CA5BB99|nr:hypothetical protein [Castellaniella caeni]
MSWRSCPPRGAEGAVRPATHTMRSAAAHGARPQAANRRTLRLLAGLAVWLSLGLPATRHWLEADMSLHMLVQLPLLAWTGWQLGRALPAPLARRLAPWNLQGISGLLLASLVMAFWMLPIALDAATEAPSAALAKFLSLPLLLGLPCALSWPLAGFVTRGVFLVELIATLFRSGWLYLASPVRLCTSYLLDAQQSTGAGLLVAGGLVLALLVLRLLVGPLRKTADSDKRADPAHRGS